LVMTPAVATITTIALWGRIIDRFGSIPTLKLTAIIICLLPLPWVLTSSYPLLLLTQVVQGFSASGFDLAVFTFYIGSLKTQERISYIAYLNAIGSICSFAGTTFGGIIVPYLPQVAHWQLQSIFILSVLMRLGPVIMFQFIHKEEHKSTLIAFKQFLLNPGLTLRTGVTTSIMRYFKR
jgi:MFS family permease